MTEEKRPGLDTMPITVVQSIAEYVNFPGVQKMRKVCKKLRADLHDYRPSLFYNSVQFDFHENKITAEDAKKGDEFPSLIYSKSEDGMVVDCKTTNKQYRFDGDFVKVFAEDMALNFYKHKATIASLQFRFHTTNAAKDLMESFVPLLDHRCHKLRVRKLRVDVAKVDDFILVFPHINPEAIRIIGLGGGLDGILKLSIKDVEKLKDFDCWKKAWMIVTWRRLELRHSASLSHFLHLKHFEVDVEILKLEDLNRVKDSMQKPTSQLRKAVIRFMFFSGREKYSGRQEFITNLGPLVQQNGEERKWYFRCENKKFSVKVEPRRVTIRLIKSFPNGVMIGSSF